MTDPVANLLKLKRLAECHASGELSTWLSVSLDAWLSDPEVDLEQALGIRNGHKGRSGRYRYREAVRNTALIMAGLELKCADLWPRAERLAQEVRTFSRRRWTRWKTLGTPPDNASELHRFLFNAFNAGLPVPESTQQLFVILADFTK